MTDITEDIEGAQLAEAGTTLAALFASSGKNREERDFGGLRGERVVNIVADIESLVRVAAIQDLYQAVGSGLGIRNVFDRDDCFEVAADLVAIERVIQFVPVASGENGELGFFREASESWSCAAAIFPCERCPDYLGPSRSPGTSSSPRRYVTLPPSSLTQAVESFQSSLKPGRFFQACSSRRVTRFLVKNFTVSSVVRWKEPRTSTSTPSTSKIITAGIGLRSFEARGSKSICGGAENQEWEPLDSSGESEESEESDASSVSSVPSEVATSDSRSSESEDQASPGATMGAESGAAAVFFRRRAGISSTPRPRRLTGVGACAASAACRAFEARFRALPRAGQ